jgi:hypothetical protein
MCINLSQCHNLAACSFGWWLVLVRSERKVLLTGCWWLVCSKRKVLMADKPNEQGVTRNRVDDSSYQWNW